MSLFKKFWKKAQFQPKVIAPESIPLVPPVCETCPKTDADVIAEMQRQVRELTTKVDYLTRAVEKATAKPPVSQGRPPGWGS